MISVAMEKEKMARYKIDCCWNCDDRKGGCHSTCKEYKEQRRELDETNDELRKKEKVNTGLNAEKAKNIERIYKRLNVKGR